MEITLNKGIWDPKLRGTNIKGTNLKSVINAAEKYLVADWGLVWGLPMNVGSFQI